MKSTILSAFILSLLFLLAGLAPARAQSAKIPEYVDLGLSVCWASFNLGASKPEEFGDYYAWGGRWASSKDYQHFEKSRKRPI